MKKFMSKENEAGGKNEEKSFVCNAEYDFCLLYTSPERLTMPGGYPLWQAESPIFF